MPTRCWRSCKTIPGAADLRIQQAFDYPQLNVNVDRTNASQVGLTQQDVANDVLISLSGSQQTAPTFWVDPKSGMQYNVTTQAPQYRLTSLQDLAATPITTGDGGGRSSCWPISPPSAAASARRW